MTDKQFDIIRHMILKVYGHRQELHIGTTTTLDFEVKDVILHRGCVVTIKVQAHHEPYVARWNFLINEALEKRIRGWFGSSPYLRIRIAPSHIPKMDGYRHTTSLKGVQPHY